MMLHHSKVLVGIYCLDFLLVFLKKEIKAHLSYKKHLINIFHSCISNGCTLSEDYHLFQLFCHCSWFKVWQLYICNETLAMHLSLFGDILAFVLFSSGRKAVLTQTVWKNIAKILSV